jgi:hypothetical protein
MRVKETAMIQKIEQIERLIRQKDDRIRELELLEAFGFNNKLKQ